jgi:hypothetical protein
MRNFKLFIFCLLCWPSVYGQTQTLSDVVVAGQKGVIQGHLISELVLKAKQQVLIKELTLEEGKYAQKRGALGNISNSLLYVALKGMMTATETKIAAIEHNILVRKLATFGFRHGLIGYESQLEREKGYFLKLQHEYSILNACLLVSGGVGYNYTAFLQFLLRTMELRKHILIIDQKVKSLMDVSRILAK